MITVHHDGVRARRRRSVAVGDRRDGAGLPGLDVAVAGLAGLEELRAAVVALLLRGAGC